MSGLPGSSGYPVFGDKSVEFYRNPQQFICKKIADTGSKVFLTRLLNAPTVFICSHEETEELLHERHQDFDHGYRDFLFNSYGDNILFEDGESATHLKSCMEPLFTRPENFHSLIARICDGFLDSLSERRNSLNIYEEFKELMTKLCLELFLGYLDSNSESSKAISRLTTLHWHGIISLPVTVKIPFAGESGWSKAQQAKKELLTHIRHRIDKSKQKLSRSNRLADNKSSYAGGVHHLLSWLNITSSRLFASSCEIFIAIFSIMLCFWLSVFYKEQNLVLGFWQSLDAVFISQKFQCIKACIKTAIIQPV